MNDKIALTALAIAAMSFASFAQAQNMAVKPPHNTLACNVCHVNGISQAPTKETCLSCHGPFEALAKKTEKLNPAFNPHNSHRGQEECTTCHGVHRQSSLACNDCHGFKGAGTQMK